MASMALSAANAATSAATAAASAAASASAAVSSLTRQKPEFKAKKGKYSVIVHVIEARELRGRGRGGMSDPVVQVECLGRKQSTCIKKKSLNPQFDQVLYYTSSSEIEPAQLECEKVTILVKDANTVLRDVLIGSYELDLSFVYYRENHELHRQWIALTDTTDNNEGIQGYLRVSVVCLGPGDEQIMHDIDDDEDDEDVGILMPPSITQEEYLLSIGVWDSNGLPAMDTGVLSRSACDPYLAVSFGGITQKSTVKSGLAVVFSERLSIPVLEPVMQDKVRVCLVDKDVGTDDLIGTHYLSYKGIKRDGMAPTWVNMYGSPEGMTKGHALAMNQGKEEGSHFRGRVMLGGAVTIQEEGKKMTVPTEYPSETPPVRSWTLQVDAYLAVEIPKSGKWKLEVCCGTYEFASSLRETDKHSRDILKWYSCIESTKGVFNLDMVYPQDTLQCPDVIVYLTRDKLRVSYFRYSFADLVQRGWDNPPQWVQMREDKALDYLTPDQFPGSVLLGIRLGTRASVPSKVSIDARPLLGEDMGDDILVRKSPHVPVGKSTEIGDLRLTILRAKSILPAGSKSCNPYIKIRVGDSVHKTKTLKRTLTPTWNEEFIFKDVPFGVGSMKIKLYDRNLLGKDVELGRVEWPIKTLAASAAGVDFESTRWIGLGRGDTRLELSFAYTFQSTGKAAKQAFVRDRTAGDLPTLKLGTKSVTSEIMEHDPLKRGDEFFGEPYMVQYLVRAHIFQCRGLEAADSSGTSDPFVQFRLGGTTVQSKVVEDTLHPSFYETLDLQAQLPTNPALMPDAHLVVYDADFVLGNMVRKEFLGRCQVTLPEIIAMSSGLTEEGGFPRPEWYPLLDVDGLRAEGEILASFSIEELSMESPAKYDLRPASEPMLLEIATLGLRGVSSTFGINKPRVDFVMQSTNERYSTSASRVPEPSNPNLLQLQYVPLDIPRDRIYAPSVGVEIIDTRFGGHFTQLVGTSAVPLEQFYPDDMDIFLNDQEHEEQDEEEQKDEPMFEYATTDKLGSIEEDEASVATSMGDDPGQLLMFNLDTDIGYIGIDDEEEEGVRLDTSLEAVVIDSVEEESTGWDADGIHYRGALPLEFGAHVGKAVHDLPDYMKGRQVIDDELEDVMNISPFYTIPVWHGKQHPKPFEPKRRQVGNLKALFRVLGEKNAPGGVNPADLLSPKPLYVRLFVLRGDNLTPMDSNGYSDPYLVIKFGKTKVSTRDRYLSKTLRPEFYEAFEFSGLIPGVAELKIEVWDWDGIGDDLIGSTTIDVEDRWFCREWRALDKKPVESRTLHNPTSSNSQGKLSLWVDILEPEAAKAHPMEVITLPPKQPFELRVVVWKCEDVAIMDEITQANDMYVTGLVDKPGMKRARTDVHMRARLGLGSFNYRLLYPLELPMRNPRFNLQIWDMDFIGANDAICEALISLNALFRYGQRTQERVIWMQNGSEKMWLELYHPNSPGVSQGKIQVSFELLPGQLAKDFPAGQGRDEPNINPTLPPPEGRLRFDPRHPCQFLKAVMGKNLFYKLALLILCAGLIAVLYFSFPLIASSLITGLL